MHHVGFGLGLRLFYRVYKGHCGDVASFCALRGVVVGLLRDASEFQGGLTVVAVRNRGEEQLDLIGVADDGGSASVRLVGVRDLFRLDSQRQGIDTGLLWSEAGARERAPKRF